MPETVTIGENGSLSNTIEGETEIEDKNAASGIGSYYTKQSGNNLYVGVEAPVFASTFVKARCWRDFTVQASSSGSDQESIRFSCPTEVNYKILKSFGAARLDVYLTLYDITDGGQSVMQSVEFDIPNEVGFDGVLKNNLTIAAEVAEPVVAGRNYRVQFEAHAYASGGGSIDFPWEAGIVDAATNEGDLSGNGKGDSQSSYALLNYSGHVTPPPEWGYLWPNLQ